MLSILLRMIPLFDIYINDLFIIKGDTEVCNYSDDTTFYVHDTSTADVIRKSETVVYNGAIWFDNFIFIFHSIHINLFLHELSFSKTKINLVNTL